VRNKSTFVRKKKRLSILHTSGLRCKEGGRGRGEEENGSNKNFIAYREEFIHVLLYTNFIILTYDKLGMLSAYS
jgi:hypothetical protein